LGYLYEVRNYINSDIAKYVDAKDSNIDVEGRILMLREIYKQRKGIKLVFHDIYKELHPEILLAEKLKLREQYDSQVKMLKDSGILRNLGETKNPPTEEYGIIGVDDKEYPLPTYEEVFARLKDPEKRKLIEKKVEQGFVKLQIVPFATNISRIIECYKQVLLKIHKDFGIKTSDGTIQELKTEKPINVWSNLGGCDNPNTPAGKQMEYGVTNYAGLTKEARGGRFKSELLQNPVNAWQISLVEDLPNLPAEGQGQTIAGRRQFEAYKSPEEYLAILNDHSKAQYQGETGQTPESALVTWLTYLYQNNQVIDESEQRGKRVTNLLVGTRLSDQVICCYWSVDQSNSELGRNHYSRDFEDSGFRPQVNI
jgi:hypothetical protein